MNAKLFLTAFILPMAMGFSNVGQAMDFDYNTLNQEQPRTTLDLKKQELDRNINEFAEKLKNSNNENIYLICRTISEFIDEVYNMKNYIDTVTGNGNISFYDALVVFTNKLLSGRRIYYIIHSKGLDNDDDLLSLFRSILELKQKIEYLKEHPEENKQINVEKNNDNEFYNIVQDRKMEIQAEISDNENKKDQIIEDLRNKVQQSNMNIIISFCYDPTYKPLIANYENNRNTVMSYLKREGISDVLKDESIIKYMKQIAQINIEIEKLQNELNNFE